LYFRLMFTKKNVMAKIFFTSVIYLIFFHLSYAQSTDNTIINIADLNLKLDSIFAKTNINEPGCAVTIIQNGKILTRKSYGQANIENQVPFTHQSVVKMPYSEAREFISIAAILMEKDGILSLHDQVRKYFPKLPEWAESVTLWDLLNHRSGFVDEWATLLLMYNNMSNRFETEQFLRLLYNQSIPEIEPGKGYMYCNSDFGLLRLIMEKASGQNLSDWMLKRIFTPLKMKSTHMQKNPLDIIPKQATMYENAVGDGYQLAHVSKTSPGGNYYILTSAEDLELWTAVVNDPTSEINAAIHNLMTNVRQIPGKENHYVIGYSNRTIDNQQVILHEGVNGYNYLTRIPSKRLSVITFGNKHDDGFAEENKAIVSYLLSQTPVEPIKLDLITKPIEVPESELVKYTGNFRWQNQVSWEGNNQPRKFSSLYIVHGKLMMRYTGNYTIQLTPVAKDIFYYKEGEDGYGVQFEFNQSSSVAPLHLTVIFDDGYPSVTMVKDTSGNWQPTTQDLVEFTGRFYSKHLDYFWNIELNEAGKLIRKSSNLPDTNLEPDGTNQFHYIGEKYLNAGFDSWIMFNKNDRGEITHLTVWSGRVMHHRFDKQ